MVLDRYDDKPCVTSVGDVSERSPQSIIKVIRVCASEFRARVAD
jgi:hypothetical protein